MWKRFAIRGLAIALLCVIAAPAQVAFDSLQRERARQMLRDLKDAVEHHYYDPEFHGIDLDAIFKAADTRLQSAQNLGVALTAIGQALDPLKDSHTFFLPPSRNTHREYGYVLQMVGERCLVTAVRPDSDAAEKLAPGDEVLAWQGFKPTRETLWTMSYVFNTLLSVPVMSFNVRSPDGKTRQLSISPKVTQDKRILDMNDDNDFWKMIREGENEDHDNRHRTMAFTDKALIWKMPGFDLNDDQLDRLIKDARKYPALIVDLRGNPGGYVKTLERLVGDVMDHDVTIAKRVGRKSDSKPQQAKSRGGSAYSGKLILLVDSRSASAAELFARIVQLEHRGTVVGDRSAGAVMESRRYSFHQGTDTEIFYGASITDADLIMADGKSLEHSGVTPDESILPSAEDLAAGRDPALARAASLAGVEMDAAKAGKLFPIEWRKD